jgi:hypothetical protein
MEAANIAAAVTANLPLRARIARQSKRAVAAATWL